MNGYSLLREQIPDNIVIMDWHYYHEGEESPSAKAFADAGNDVLGTNISTGNSVVEQRLVCDGTKLGRTFTILFSLILLFVVALVTILTSA
jgi:hypothetical protein